MDVSGGFDLGAPDMARLFAPHGTTLIDSRAGLANGAYTLEVEAVDRADNVRAPATRLFTVAVPATQPASQPSAGGHAKASKPKAGHKVKVKAAVFHHLPTGHHREVVWYVDGKKVGTGTRLKLRGAWRGHR